VPVTIEKRVTIFDFMTYARNVSLDKLKTFGQFVESLWRTLQYHSRNAHWINIIFHLYLDNSIKHGKRVLRQKAMPIDIIISSSNQPLPGSFTS